MQIYDEEHAIRRFFVEQADAPIYAPRDLGGDWLATAWLLSPGGTQQYWRRRIAPTDALVITTEELAPASEATLDVADDALTVAWPADGARAHVTALVLPTSFCGGGDWTIVDDGTRAALTLPAIAPLADALATATPLGVVTSTYAIAHDTAADLLAAMGRGGLEDWTYVRAMAGDPADAMALVVRDHPGCD